MSTATTKTPVLLSTTTKTILKNSNEKKWEIENIGCFMLQIYHQHVVSPHSDWKVLKLRVHEEFEKFLNTLENANIREKFKKDSGTTDIGALLSRTNFLTNTTDDSDHYRIKFTTLFQYRNRKVDEFDEKSKYGKNESGLRQIPETNADADVTTKRPNEDGLGVWVQVDENSKSTELIYKATDRQKRIPDFCLSTKGCFICQRNFESRDLLETHVDYHGAKSNFESLKQLENSCSSIFKLSYKLCKNSSYYCFTLETDLSGIIIDQIIVVGACSMDHVHSTCVPYALPPSGRQRLFVYSDLFKVNMFQPNVERPVVVMCHVRGNEKTRIMEQHHVIMEQRYPIESRAYRQNGVQVNIFKQKFELLPYLPPDEMFLASKNDFATSHLVKISNDFGNYFNNGKVFTQKNMQKAMEVLLQVEDIYTTRDFPTIKLPNVQLRKHSAEEYSFKIPVNTGIEKVSPLDEVVLKPEHVVTRRDSEKVYYGTIERIWNGEVTFESEREISIEQTYTITFQPPRLVLRYQYRALELYGQMPDSDKKRFLFPEAMTPLQLPTTSLVLHNESISTNPEQLQAVRNIAEGPRSDATYIIFGPPGTGKTTTVVEAILQLYRRRPETKILVTAGSNAACDEIARRLCTFFDRIDQSRAIVRIYSRSSKKRRDHIDECLLEFSNMCARQFYPTIGTLHEFRIVVCTLSVVGKLATGHFGKDDCGNRIYTHVFVDEVAASTEPEILVGIMSTLHSQASLILAGDHKQLGPILQSTHAEELGLGVSLLERLLKRACYRVDANGNYDRTIQTRLCRNYRSHPDIVNLYSRMYYDSELIALANEDDVKILSQQWHRSPNPNYPIIFHSVFGHIDRKTSSLYNLMEVEVVMDYVKDLMYFGVNGRKITQSDIGIISPYKNQYLRIQDELNLLNWNKIETGSVETFQGKEKPIIIVSFVRSFTSTLGFLKSPRRLNVTLSRSKSLLILIGNPKTLSSNHDFKYIIDECRRKKTIIDGIHTNTNPIKNSPVHKNSTEIVRSLTKSIEELKLDSKRSLENQIKSKKY